MPKRPLTVQNKENDPNPQQASATNTKASTSTKRASTNDPIPAKKAKTDTSPVEQENRPPNTNPAPMATLIHSPLLPLLYGLLRRNAYDADNDDDDDDDESDIDTDDSYISSSPDEVDEEPENQQAAPMSLLADNIGNGEDHPTNKQYLVFKNSDPTKEDYIISKTARYWSLRYRKALRHVNPDFYGMYIHADFSCYGELEVVENCLRDLTRTLFYVQQGVINASRKSAEKVNYILGFRRLEALTILLEYTDGISGIDDGDRFYDIMRVIGACYVTILRGLLPKEMFEPLTTIDENLMKKLRRLARQIPNFKHVLEHALIIGHLFLTIADVCSAYTKILQVCSQHDRRLHELILALLDHLLQLDFSS